MVSGKVRTLSRVGSDPVSLNFDVFSVDYIEFSTSSACMHEDVEARNNAQDHMRVKLMPRNITDKKNRSDAHENRGHHCHSKRELTTV